MKGKIKMVCIIFAVVLSVSVFGCKKNDGAESSTPTDDNSGQIVRKFNDTVHIYDVGETGIPFIENGKTDYVIVYPSALTSDKYILNAVSELKFFIKEATGINIEAYSDDVYKGSDRIISLDKTAQCLADSAVSGKMKEKDLKDQGFIIKTSGSSVYIAGNRPIASMNGAYEFLHGQFNYSYYAPEAYTIDRNVRNSKLKNFNVTDVPDVQFRMYGNGENMIGQDHVFRLRMNDSADFYPQPSGLYSTHNYFYFVPKTYMETHPEWFSTDGQQLCFTRDPDGIRAVILDKMKETFLSYPDKDSIPFMLNDGGTWCTCEKCLTQTEGFGYNELGITANHIVFLNKLADELKQWNTEVCPERNLKIYMMSYGRLRGIPVEKKANGEYAPIDEKYVFRDNLGVQVTYGTGSVYNFYDPANADKSEVLDNYGLLTNNILHWQYSACFEDYLMPFNTLESRKDFYQKIHELGGLMYFENSRWDSGYSSDWNVLKSYLASRLTWNCELDINGLIDEFCDNYFGKASSVMKEMLFAYRGYTAYLYNEKGVICYVHAASDCNEKNWPYGKVREFLGYIDLAYEAIAPLSKEDPAEYERLYTRICRESITYRYMNWKLYPNTIDPDRLKKYKQSIVDDCRKTGIVNSAEYSSIADIFG